MSLDLGAVEQMDAFRSRGGERKVTLLPDPEPREARYTVISVDDHIVEPPDMFEGRVPSK